MARRSPNEAGGPPPIPLSRTETRESAIPVRCHLDRTGSHPRLPPVGIGA